MRTHIFGTCNVCLRTHRKTTRRESAHYLLAAASAPRAAMFQQGRGCIKDRPTRRVLPFDCSLDFNRERSRQPANRHPPLRPIRQLNEQSSISRISNLQNANTPEQFGTPFGALDNCQSTIGPAEHSSGLPEQPRRSRSQTQFRKHYFNNEKHIRNRLGSNIKVSTM